MTNSAEIINFKDRGHNSNLEKPKQVKAIKQKRKGLSNKIRFEVFKRDSFSCQYCGQSAPDVVLNADHIKPVAKGGDNSITNLITSCFDCNSGKSDRELDDKSVLNKQKQQLDNLNERRIQIELMMQWQQSMRDMDTFEIDSLAEEWNAHIDGYSLNDSAKEKLKRLLKKYSFADIVKAMDKSADQYIKYNDDDDLITDSANNAFNKIGAILRNKDMPEEERSFYYIRGILRNRLNYINERECIKLIKEAHEAGGSMESITNLSKDVKNWTEFANSINAFLKDNGTNNG
mgnify:CR=1 FL=1